MKKKTAKHNLGNLGIDMSDAEFEAALNLEKGSESFEVGVVEYITAATIASLSGRAVSVDIKNAIPVELKGLAGKILEKKHLKRRRRLSVRRKTLASLIRNYKSKRTVQCRRNNTL